MGILPLAGIEPQFPSHLARRMFTLGRLIESVAVHSIFGGIGSQPDGKFTFQILEPAAGALGLQS